MIMCMYLTIIQNLKSNNPKISALGGTTFRFTFFNYSTVILNVVRIAKLDTTILHHLKVIA